MRCSRYAAAGLLVLCLAIMGCGGGGGGGGSGGGRPAGPSISINPTNLTATFTRGQSIPLPVTATVSAPVSQTVYITIVDSVGVLAPNVTISAVSDTTYTVTLFTSTTAPLGAQTGTIRVNVCYDTACASHLGNSPLSIPFSFQVNAPNSFSATPATLTHSQTTGASTPLSVTISPSQTLQDPLFFRVAAAPVILSANATFTATGTGSYTASIPTSPTLLPGRHTGSLNFSVCRDSSCFQHVSGSPFAVPYDFTIVPRPAASFTLVPTMLTGSYVTGRAAPLSLSVTSTVPVLTEVYARFTESSGLLSPAVSVVRNANGTSLALNIQSTATTAAGRYTGTAALLLCANADCTSPIIDGPLSVPYDLQVLPPITVNPGTLTGRFSAGFPFATRATVTRNTDTPVYVTVQDGDGAFQSTVDFTQLGTTTYALALYAARSLTPQQHRIGQVALRVCSDQACTNPVPGSPVRVPYDLIVESLRALTPVSGVPEWETYQGNPAHTGYSPLEIDVSKIVPRWMWSAEAPSLQSGYNEISTLAIKGNRVFVSANKKLYALDELDADGLWSYDFSGVEASPGLSSVTQLNPPAVSDSHVYVATSGHQGTYMWGFTVADGVQRFRTPFGAQWESYYAPTIYGGRVYTNGGYYGGMYAFDGTTGEEEFFTGLQQFDEWTPALDATYAYAYIGGQTAYTPAQLNIIDRLTGTLVASIEDHSYSWAGYSMDTSPVIGVPGSVTAVNVSNSYQNSLINFDTVGRSIRWSAAGGYVATPAYASGVLYALNRSPLRLEARSETTGALLWTWTPQRASENAFISEPLVTNNVVFVSTNEAVHAIDRTTHTSIWSYPKSGRLALSANGILYISTYSSTGNVNDGDVVALDVNR